MSTHSDALGGAGPPLTFDHEGRTYTLRKINDHTRALVEQWLRKAAYADLYTLRGVMPADQYSDALSAITRDRASYAYEGPVYWKTIATQDGVIGLTAIILQTDEADARKLLDARGPDVAERVQENLIQGMPRAQAEMVRQRLAVKPEAEDAPVDPPAPA